MRTKWGREKYGVENMGERGLKNKEREIETYKQRQILRGEEVQLPTYRHKACE